MRGFRDLQHNHICIYIYMYVYIYIYMYYAIYVTHTYIYIYMYVCVCLFNYLRRKSYIYIYIYLFIYIYIYSLSPTSRQAPENFKATDKILQIQNLLSDFQGFQGFNLASGPVIFKRHKVKLTPKRNFWCLDSCALCFCFLFVAFPFAFFPFVPSLLRSAPHRRSAPKDGPAF